MNPPYTVAQVLAATGPILLDFDGPICAVFATIPDHTVAAKLRRILAAHNVDIPPNIQAEKDPLAVLRFTATIGSPDLITKVENELCAAELVAIDGAKPTPHAREVIVAANRAGRPVAIVSNNSAAAINRYLDAHRLTRYITAVVGRAHADPTRMKPNPEPILHAVQAVNAKPSACVLIGDSLSDIEGGRAAQVCTIGYANKADKRELLIQAGACAIVEGIDGMVVVAQVLQGLTMTSGNYTR